MKKIKRVGRNGLSINETINIAEKILIELKQGPLKQAFGYLEAGAIFCEPSQCILLSLPIASALSLLVSVNRHNDVGLFTLQSSFISPDVAMAEIATASADTFSLGAIIYYMLNGHLPFVLDSSLEASYKQTVPATVSKLEPEHWLQLQRSLAFKKEERQNNAEELLFQLTQKPIISNRKPLIIYFKMAALSLAILMVSYWLYPLLNPSEIELQKTLYTESKQVNIPNKTSILEISENKDLSLAATPTTIPSHHIVEPNKEVVQTAPASVPSIILGNKTNTTDTFLIEQERKWAELLEKQRLEAEKNRATLEAKNKALAEAEKKKLELEQQLQLLNIQKTNADIPKQPISSEVPLNKEINSVQVTPRLPTEPPKQISNANVGSLDSKSTGVNQFLEPLSSKPLLQNNNQLLANNKKPIVNNSTSENNIMQAVRPTTTAQISRFVETPKLPQTSTPARTTYKQEVARLIYKTVAGQVRFPNPRAFGPIDPNEQDSADSSCRQIGAIKAIGYHPKAINLDGSIFSSYYCHFPDAPDNEESLVGAQPSPSSPRLVQKKILAWDKPHLFEPIPPERQSIGNNICQKAGFSFATDYYPHTIDEKGRPMPQGGYICDN